MWLRLSQLDDQLSHNELLVLTIYSCLEKISKLVYIKCCFLYILTVLKQMNLYVYMWDVAYQLYVFSLTNSIIVKNSKNIFAFYLQFLQINCTIYLQFLQIQWQIICRKYRYSGNVYVKTTDIVALYLYFLQIHCHYICIFYRYIATIYVKTTDNCAIYL